MKKTGQHLTATEGLSMPGRWNAGLRACAVTRRVEKEVSVLRNLVEIGNSGDDHAQKKLAHVAGHQAGHSVQSRARDLAGEDNKQAAKSKKRSPERCS